MFSNQKELWYLRIGFVFLIGRSSSASSTSRYSTREGRKCRLRAREDQYRQRRQVRHHCVMSLIMFACSRTTHARDSIVTNHLKTAVDVVRRVEKERWCNNHEPIALPILERINGARTNASRFSWTARNLFCELV